MEVNGKSLGQSLSLSALGRRQGQPISKMLQGKPHEFVYTVTRNQDWSEGAGVVMHGGGRRKLWNYCTNSSRNTLDLVRYSTSTSLWMNWQTKEVLLTIWRITWIWLLYATPMAVRSFAVLLILLKEKSWSWEAHVTGKSLSVCLFRWRKQVNPESHVILQFSINSFHKSNFISSKAVETWFVSQRWEGFFGHPSTLETCYLLLALAEIIHQNGA